VITLKKKGKITNAVESLYQRYIGDSLERRVSLETERVNADVAQAIYDLRKEAGLTQKELADLVGTTQSVISRLEDADYEGHSLSMLSRIAGHLNRRLVIKMVPPPVAKQSPDEGILKQGEHRYQHHVKGFLRPGQIAPRSGRYQQIGPRGGLGKEVNVVKGEALPPTPREKMTYVLVGAKKTRSVARSGIVSERDVSHKRKQKKAK
jgi:transcriptional regulator with XRE-family HTH domain